MTKTFSLILTLLFFYSSFGFANWENLPLEHFALGRPPVAGSLVEQEDVQTLLDLQQSRTQKDCALARSQLSPGFLAFFGNSWGIFSSAELQKATPLMNRVSKLVVKATAQFKNKYRRPRPYSAYSQIKPCVPLPGGSKSYPSSHASVSAAQACILAEMFPDKADAIRAYGDYLGNLRMMVGVHYPSDVQAGKNLGQEICQILLADPGFQKEMN